MRRLPLTRKKLVGFRCTEYQHPLFGKVWEFRQGQGGKHWETGPLLVGCRSQQRPVVHSFRTKAAVFLQFKQSKNQKGHRGSFLSSVNYISKKPKPLRP